MNPQQPSFGRGSPLLGGLSGVAQGMMQPGGSNVLTQQQSPTAPGFNENTTIPPAPSMPQGNPMAQFTQGLAPQGQPQGQPKPPQPPKDPIHARADMIVKALVSHLSQLDKLLGGI